MGMNLTSRFIPNFMNSPMDLNLPCIESGSNSVIYGDKMEKPGHVAPYL